MENEGKKEDDTKKMQISDINKSICKIVISKVMGKGYLIKLEKKENPFYCLISSENVIKEKMVDLKRNITVFYNNEKEKIEITLDKDERFIRSYKYMKINLIVVQILPKDNIGEEYFLLPNLDYINGYEQFDNKDIYVPEIPKGEKSIGKIKLTKSNPYEFQHLLKTPSGSSGCPIFLKDSTLALGMHVQAEINKKENFCYFIGPVIDSLKKDFNFKKFYEDGILFEIEEEQEQDKKGFGKITFKNDNYYIGQILDLKMNGKGTLYNKNNVIIYEGNLINNKYEGNGKLFYDNGNYYDGEFVDNTEHGKGKLYKKINNILYNIMYDGDWNNGKYEGSGKLIYEDGNYYLGEFINGKPNGKGKLYDKNNKIIFEGEYASGKKEGNGKLYLENGNYYIGNFTNGQKHGSGKFIIKIIM